MKKTKRKILDTALNLYNRNGVSNVSIRQIAKTAGISHSNLIYHFPTQEDVILGLHGLLLKRALQLNQGLELGESPLESLFRKTRSGFSVVYDFQFIFKDMHYVCNSFPRVNAVIRDVEHLRSKMYKEVVQDFVSLKLFRKEQFQNEFDHLITLIKIYSDHWLVSSDIYDDLPKDKRIDKYSNLFMVFFYPYLTEKGKKEFRRLGILGFL